MDPVSQAALGAVVAHAAAHRTLGVRALAMGAAAGAMPDLDVLWSLSGDAFDQMRMHRGITHSLFFAPVVGPLLGYLAWRVERRGGTDRLRAWVVALTLALLSHPLLDLTTPYGTQLLLPFSDARFAIWAMSIIDPAYTVVLLAGVVVAWRRPHWRPASVIALGVSTAYVAYAWYLNEAAEDAARTQLRAEGVEHVEVAAFPTFLQVHYRRVVARTDGEVLTGFVSMWRPCPIAWSAAPRLADDSVAAWRDSREGRIFEWFAMGWVHHVPTDGGLVSADLRYGFSTDPGISAFSTVAEFDEGGDLVRVSDAGRARPDFFGRGGLLASAYPESCQAVSSATPVQQIAARPAATEA
ncbi:MAG: metal-dependent hydrolase [Gammaproteobacteria bacterium]|nr:metal-dependent hydrolase [Gammaproteobacteria bacterium]